MLKVVIFYTEITLNYKLYFVNFDVILWTTKVLKTSINMILNLITYILKGIDFISSHFVNFFKTNFKTLIFLFYIYVINGNYSSDNFQWTSKLRMKRNQYKLNHFKLITVYLVWLIRNLYLKYIIENISHTILTVEKPILCKLQNVILHEKH